jgi:hypothetical protein
MELMPSSNLSGMRRSAQSFLARKEGISQSSITIGSTLTLRERISRSIAAASEGWQISPILHNWQNEEPILLTVLFNRVLGTGLPGFKTLSNGILRSSILSVDSNLADY